MIISSQNMERQMVQQLMNDEMEDMEGNGRDLTEILSWNLLRGTEENYKTSRYLVSQPRFEPSTSQVHKWSDTNINLPGREV
jgi:hypothetical protein